jgi:hypothetical protein
MRSNQLSYRALAPHWLFQWGRKYNDPLRFTRRCWIVQVLHRWRIFLPWRLPGPRPYSHHGQETQRTTQFLNQ